ncbi:MAG: GNAT family N-acetyltransferase [Chloroflexi bacterium]|nr:GNAT family N-acetyltransferase [Chloroflexota bacterium]
MTVENCTGAERRAQQRAPATRPAYTAVPASHYTYDDLAEIYNRSRVDYIVPMPMNARRMEEYIQFYDVRLDASVVTLDEDGSAIAVGMLGLRGDQAWLTRLGVIPERRGRGKGLFTMTALLERAVDLGARSATLEVIEGNEPARHLFAKLGFQPMRKLLVIRRPPGPSNSAPPTESIKPMSEDEIMACLRAREPGASWLDATESLLNAGSLEGLSTHLASGEYGCIVYRYNIFQLSHFLIRTWPPGNAHLAETLLRAVHHQHAAQDSKMENIPLDSPYWPAFQQVGYSDSFVRIEMACDL